MATEGPSAPVAQEESKKEEEQAADEPSIVDDPQLWTDVSPVPQADAERPMVQIAYAPEYRKAMDLLRALMARNELSERALSLTTLVLQYNIAHYTVWHYRSQILRHLHHAHPHGKHIQEELAMLDKQMANMRKSYQAWQHRALLVELLQDVSREIAFVDQVLTADPKNYQTWTYRQSLLCRYNRAEMWAGELSTIERLLGEDVHNNSAWNHRFFVVFDSFPLHTPALTPAQFEATVDRELAFVEAQLLQAPNNPSAWNYLRGVMKRALRPLASVEHFVRPLSKSARQLDAEDGWPGGANKQADLPATGAVEFLADMYAQSGRQAAQAVHLYGLLAETLDPIRKGYWTYRSRKALAEAGAPEGSS